MSSASYLSQVVVFEQERKRKICFIAGAIGACFFLFGIVEGLIGATPALREGLPLYVICFAAFALLLLNGVRVSKRIDAAKRYETIFVADRDGVVTAEELCAQTGKSQDAVFKELETLFQKGFFQNCGLRRGGVPCVIIADAMNGESGVGFADVTCASCGATTRMRAGSRGHCPYCGKPIVDTTKQ